MPFWHPGREHARCKGSLTVNCLLGRWSVRNFQVFRNMTHMTHNYFVFHHFLIAGRVVRTTQFDAFICAVIMLNTLVTLCFQEGRRWSRLFSGHDIQASITAYACSAFACAQGWRLNHSTWDFSEDTTLVSKALHYQRAAWLLREMHQE